MNEGTEPADEEIYFDEMQGDAWKEDDENKSESALPPVTDDSIAQLRAHTKDVFCLAVSNSKRWLASGSEDDSAAVWDLDNGGTDPFLRIMEHVDSVTCVAFNHSSTILATGDMSGLIVCTRIEQRTMLCKIEDSTELEWLTWHPSADILFAGSSEGLIWMWLISDSGVSQSKVYTSGTGSSCVAGKLLPDARHLIAVYSEGLAQIWNLKEATSTTIKLQSPCCSLDVHEKMNLAAIGCEDGTTTLVNTQNGKTLSVLGTKTEDENQEIITEENTEDSEETSNKEQLDPARNSVEVVRFTSQFPWLAVGTSGGSLTIYDFETGVPRHQCEHDGMAVITCLWRKLEGTSLQIVSACIDGAIRIWDAKSGEPVLLASGVGDEIYDLNLLEKENDETRLLTACSNGVIRVFKC